MQEEVSGEKEVWYQCFDPTYKTFFYYNELKGSHWYHPDAIRVYKDGVQVTDIPSCDSAQDGAQGASTPGPVAQASSSSSSADSAAAQSTSAGEVPSTSDRSSASYGPSKRCPPTGDHDMVLAAVSQDGEALQYVAEEWLADRDIVLAAVSNNGAALFHAAEALKSDREIVLAAVSQNGTSLTCAAKSLRSDREVVLAAVSQNGSALICAPEHLRDDPEILRAAVSHGYFLLDGYAHLARFEADHDVMLAAVSLAGEALAYASDELRQSRDIVLAAVRRDGEALGYASYDLRADHEIVQTAVSQDGEALMFASEEWQADRDMVLVAVSQSGKALAYASRELQADPDIVQAAMSHNGQALRHAADIFLQDETFAPEVRQQLYFFKIVALSGRSCYVAQAADTPFTACEVLNDACYRLDMERRGTEMLLHGSETVPDGFRAVRQWPGSPETGRAVEYQLVRW